MFYSCFISSAMFLAFVSTGQSSDHLPLNLFAKMAKRPPPGPQERSHVHPLHTTGLATHSVYAAPVILTRSFRFGSLGTLMSGDLLWTELITHIQGANASNTKNNWRRGAPEPFLLCFTALYQASSNIFTLHDKVMIANQKDAPFNSYHFIFLQHSKNILQLQSDFRTF